MADESTTTAEPGAKPDGAKPEETSASTETTTPSDEEIIASAKNPDAVRAALEREREAAKKAREEASKARAEIEKRDREKEDSEKSLADRVTSAESKAAAAELTVLRYEAAAEADLPLNMAPRLQGSTKEELVSDAEGLKKDLGGKSSSTSLDQGAREAAETPASMDDRIRAAGGRGRR